MSTLKTISLDKVKASKSCTIVKLGAKDKLLQKLLDMGFIAGTTIKIVREAPLYDPVELKIHNYTLTLRKSEATLIEVVECS